MTDYDRVEHRPVSHWRRWRNRLPRLFRRSAALSSKQNTSRCWVLAAMLGAAVAASMILAPSAAARSAEGGQVCTGPQQPTNNCHPLAVQQVPPGDQMPEGCNSSGPTTKACGRATLHRPKPAQSDQAIRRGQPPAGTEPHSHVLQQPSQQPRDRVGSRR
jgi:hypothetical protein